MPWLKTIDDQLIHAEGELASILTGQGAVEVSDEVALAEVESGAAQAAADDAAADAAQVDAGVPVPPAENQAEVDTSLAAGDTVQPDAQPDDAQVPEPLSDAARASLTVDATPYPPLSPTEQDLVDTAIADETPPAGGRRKR